MSRSACAALWQARIVKKDCSFGAKRRVSGLTGVTRIVLSEQGVVAESVAYDLNMACAVLRDAPSSCRSIAGEEW